LFAIPDATEDPTHGLLVVVEHDGQAAALLVDELLGQQQVVIKSLDTDFTKVRGIAAPRSSATGASRSSSTSPDRRQPHRRPPSAAGRSLTLPRSTA
jgi:two-component system chemotaxis sensor kinase CheA